MPIVDSRYADKVIGSRVIIKRGIANQLLVEATCGMYVYSCMDKYSTHYTYIIPSTDAIYRREPRDCVEEFHTPLLRD